MPRMRAQPSPWTWRSVLSLLAEGEQENVADRAATGGRRAAVAANSDCCRTTDRTVGAMVSGALHDAIMVRHRDDLVVPECKNGPTHTARHLRLDYWVLRRSWTRPAMIGYECKASRADFLRDNKWAGYLPMCNELWFAVADASVIRVDELPESVGLLRLAGSRFVTVRRAVYREIETPADVMTYVLMCRTRVSREHQDATSAVDYWRRWLVDRSESQALGRAVGKRLHELYTSNVVEVRRRAETAEQENERLRGLMQRYDKLTDDLRALDVDPRWASAEQVRDALRLPSWDRATIEHAHQALGKLLGVNQ